MIRLPQSYDAGTLSSVLNAIDSKLNSLASGRLSPRDSGLTSAPTTGDYAKGDVAWHTSPTATGSPEYVVVGWICVASGSPGTWKEMRVLTGL